MEKEFKRVRSAKDITISISLIIAGGALVALPTSVSVNIVGFFLIFAGILLAFILQTGYRDAETGIQYCKKEKFFPQSCRDRLASGISASPEKLDTSSENQGNGLRLDIYYNKKADRSYVRLYEYIPYKYHPASPAYEYRFSDISSLIK